MGKKQKTNKKLKLSTRMSHPSNPHLICSNKEVMVQLESLSDSVVAEMTACGSAVSSDQVNASTDDVLDINSFPDDILLEVFSYLEQRQLAQIARVCRRWNELAKDAAFWKKVDVKFSPSDVVQTTVAKSLINGLPSCVTSIRIDFTEDSRWTGRLDFAKLCVTLQEKCRHLEELTLSNTKFSQCLPLVMDLCRHFLQDLKVLVFHHCVFPVYSERSYFSETSKIEVLNLSGCDFGGYVRPHFSRMPCLKVLYLRNTNVYVSWFLNDIPFLSRLHVLDLGFSGISTEIFHAIMYHGLNLKEIYLCENYLTNNCLNFNNSVFPHLKTICLSRSLIKCAGVVSLIRSCPSLENVYVDQHVAESFAAHPFVAAYRCKLEIVKSIDPIHKHNVDYSYT